MVTISRRGLGWEVFHKPARDQAGPTDSMTCEKLIVATGIVSIPSIPELDLSNFNGISFHAKEIGQRHPELLADTTKHITVIGGHKSALEAVGTCSQAGKNVEWLIRKDGGGPTWMFPARDPKGNPNAKMKALRVMSILGPSAYNTDRWLNRFIHGGTSWLGTWLLKKCFRAMSDMMLADRYTKSENGKKLKPHNDKYANFQTTPTVLYHIQN